MTGLLQLLRVYEREVEADLLRFYQVDYLDRWRGRLTLRRIHVLVRALPDESALVRRVRPASWPIEAHLLDDVRMQVAALANTRRKPKPHPQRVFHRHRRAAMTPERKRKMRDARRRAAARRREFGQQDDWHEGG